MRYLIFCLCILLAACGGADDDAPRAFPTLLEAPTTAVAQAITGEATAEVTPDGRSTLPATWTPTLTPTTTETLTVTPSNTITDTPTYTPTLTPSTTPEPSVFDSLVELAAQFTPLPTEFVVRAPTLTPIGTQITLVADQPPSPTLLSDSNPPAATPGTPVTGNCQYAAPGAFGTALAANPTSANQLGCPVGSPPVIASLSGAYQPFERGAMTWVNDSPGVIYILYNDGSYQRVPDTFDAAVDPESTGESPPQGLLEPVRGFGKVWRTIPGVRDRLGWATTTETGGTTSSLLFNTGRMLAVTGRGGNVALLHQGDPATGSWQSLP